MEAPQNFVLLVTLNESGPPFCQKINRTLSLPPSTTFNDLHIAIQLAFEWTNRHPYIFELYQGPEFPVTKLNYLKSDHRVERQPDYLVQRRVEDGGRAKAPLDYEKLYRSRADKLEQRDAYLSRGYDKEMANRIVRLKKIPKEVVATKLTVEGAWGRNEDLIAIYEFGRDWNHCIKFLQTSISS